MKLYKQLARALRARANFVCGEPSPYLGFRLRRIF